ncbi:MAG: FtsW/RodA/SpoVE family cell cycle protein [Chloroflexi bacterium]|nr:FtsW/RodA/SpoVE family cell cycle protein [Chloroflexota bacterium]
MATSRNWRHFDYVLLVVVILLTVLGVVMIRSANLGSPDEDLQQLWRRQATFGVVGIGFVFILAAFPRNYQWLGDFWWLAYLLAVASLVLVLFFGESQVGEVRGWFNLGIINVQPAFIAMILLIISVGSVLSKPRTQRKSRTPLFGMPKTSLTVTQEQGGGFVSFLASTAMTMILAGLIFAQPDMGAAAVLVSIWLAMLLQSDVRMSYLVMTGVAGVLAIVPLWELMEVLEFEYMRTRVFAFLNPSGNPDVRYQLEQAFIAIGSGGFWGKGLSQGTQSQLRYLPVRHTDFIFAVLAEELGFFGVVILFLLFLVLFLRLLRIVFIAGDVFGRLIAAGVLAMVFFQFFTNVGMNLGLLPVVGLPLPFITYGPAALLTTMLGIGLAENVAMRHRKQEF